MSKKEQLVDKNKLKALVEKELNRSCYADTFKEYKHQSRKNWPDHFKHIYRNIYSNCYNALRKEVREKKQKFWLTMAGKENFNTILNKYGLYIDRWGHIRFANMGVGILKWYLEKIVIPELEKTFNITGITVGRTTSPMATTSVLNLEKVEVKHDEEKIEEIVE